jgi:hypothetical protein
MRFARPAALVLFALLLAPGAGAATRAQSASFPAPSNLHGFLLRANEPSQDTFTRTPSFAWAPVAGANHYEFQLATSRTFASGALLARKTTRAPAVSLAISLPWITGTPYSLYARVRGLSPNGSTTPWSPLFGFNMRWTSLPAPLDAVPGLIRWTPVDGATAYQVWYLEPNKIFKTQTTVADEREYYTFHQDVAWTGAVHWRIRAVRALYGNVHNALPSVSYGPWSAVYTSTNTAFATGPLSGVETISDSVSTAATPAAHHVMPAFAFTGDTGVAGTPAELYRVYVATDRDCVNIVFRGAVVGSPAYAPRWNGTLALPATAADQLAARTRFLDPGSEGLTTMSDSTPVTANEALQPADFTITSGEDDSPANGDTDGPPPATKETGPAPKFPQAKLDVDKSSVGPLVDLWDTDWPTGRYYWTVVPVGSMVKAALSTTLGATATAGSTTINVAAGEQLTVGDVLKIGTGPAQETVTVVSASGSSVTISPALANTHGAGDAVVRSGGDLTYQDLELPQDACAAGRVLSFGKTGQPALASSGNLPFASGLSPDGKLKSASSSRPAFYGTPLISWQPALAATAYEVQWSKTRYPFVTVTTPILTYGTSTMLPLTPGKWWYRVRGINLGLPGGARAMAWSQALPVTVAKPTFKIVGASSGSSSRASSTTKRFDKGAFTIAVPKTWHELNAHDTVYLFVARDPKTHDGLHATVNVLSASGRRGRTFAEWGKALTAQAKRLAYGAVATRTVDEPGRTALLMTYRMKRAGGKLVNVYQYAFDAGKQSYRLTFVVAATAAKQYTKTFARTAASFSF